MAAKGNSSTFCLGDKPGSDAPMSQFGINPQQIDKQPARIEIADQPSLYRLCVVPDEDTKIVIAMIDQKRLVVVAEPLIDKFAILPGRVFLNAEVAAARQLHGEVL